MKSVLSLFAAILLLSSCTNKSNPGGADSKYYSEPTTGPGQNSHGKRHINTSATIGNSDSSMHPISATDESEMGSGGDVK